MTWRFATHLLSARRRRNLLIARIGAPALRVASRPAPPMPDCACCGA